MKQTSKPLPRLPPRKKKKAKRLEIEAAAIARGTELGKFQAHKRKPLLESIKMHIGEMIDNIDPVELIAIVGTTSIVHGAILTGTDLMDKAKKYGLSLSMGWDLSELLVNLTTGEITKPAPPDSMELWLTSFAIAFILVRHAGQIISGLTNFGGMASLVGMFL